MIFKAHIKGRPVPASRPRVTRWGAYHTKTYSEWMKNAFKQLKDQPMPPEVFTGPVHVHVAFIFDKKKTSKLIIPTGDIDNYLKGVLDVITKLGTVWKDDVQVTSVNCVKKFTRSGIESGVYVIVERDEDG